MDGQRVTRLGPLDEERARLRVHERELDDLADDVLRSPYPTPERVLHPQLEHVARLHLPDRRDPAEGPYELGGLRSIGDDIQITHGGPSPVASGRLWSAPGCR